MSNTPTKPTRHGKRADGIVLMTIPVSAALKKDLQALADFDQRSLSAFVRMRLVDLARRSRAARKAKGAA